MTLRHPRAGGGPVRCYLPRLFLVRIALPPLALLARRDLLLLLLLGLGVLLLHALLVDEHAGAAADRRAEERVVAAHRVSDEPASRASDEAPLLVGAECVRGKRRRGERDRGGGDNEAFVHGGN